MINSEVRKSVDMGEIQQTRTNLLMITLLDRGFLGTEFDESLNYAKKLDGLFVEFDNEPIKEEWDEDYWNYLYASLMDNFCQERIDLLKKVGKKVYPPKAKTTTSTTGPSSPGPSEIPPVPRPIPRPIRGPGPKPGIPLHIKVGGAIAVAALGCATIGITKTAVAAAAIVGCAIALQKRGRR